MPTVTHVMSDETGQEILEQLTAISQALDSGALSNSQISTVLNDGTPTGSGFLDGGGLKSFFDGLKAKFSTQTDLDTAEQDISDLQDAVGDVDVSTDGSLQEQIDELGVSVSKITYSGVARIDFYPGNQIISMRFTLDNGNEYVLGLTSTGIRLWSSPDNKFLWTK